MITAKPKKNYNPNGSVSQKYAPLYDIKISDSTQAQTIVQGREGFLKTRTTTTGLDPTLSFELQYFGVDITNCVKNENTKAKTAGKCVPPVCVISSNRSEWIKTKYNSMRRGVIQHQGIKSTDYFKKYVSNEYDPIPIYFPERLMLVGGQERSVYIFVRLEEYSTYRKKFADITGITVIGWITPKFPYNENSGMFGFGMSRYAAVEFVKYIYKEADSSITFDKMWLIDDNVSYLSGNQNLAYFEQKIGDNTFEIGFKGDNCPKEKITIEDPKKVVRFDGTTPKFLIQQMMLLNIKLLSNSTYSYNFSPCFILSGEDYSFTQILNKHDFSILFDGDFQIKKGLVESQDHDNTSGLTKAQTEKNYEVYKLYYFFEKGLKFDLTNTSLSEILPPNHEEPLHTTATKAVEQILKTGTAKIGNDNWPAAGVYNELFTIKSQVILQDS